MGDERIRDLERAYQASGAPVDRVRWLEAKARATGSERDRLKLAIATYDPVRLESRIRDFVRARVEVYRSLRRKKERHAWRPESVKATLDLLSTVPVLRFRQLFWRNVAETTAELWFSMFRAPTEIESVAMVTIGGWTQRVTDVASAMSRWELEVLPSDPDLCRATLRGLVSDAVDTVVERSNCDDAWYGDVAGALTLLLLEVGVELEPLAETELNRLAESHFDSWVSPDVAMAQRFADEVAALAVRLKFRGHYGEPND
ncbi:hypothetical protein OAX78_00475 [Planctomycetota bacterium]|nr:hypothetical protein [Planctomycetota bacterium]